MSKGHSGHFRGTKGAKLASHPKLPQNKVKTPLFSNTGHVSYKSISANREFFYNKSVKQIDDVLKSQGYSTIIRKSTHESSKASVIVSTNSDSHRNITQVQISPGSLRHGNVPYVKISTNNAGKFKIIDAPKSQYLTDGKETAIMFFRRLQK